MKKFVLWLIKVFRLDIQTIKYVPSNTIVDKVYVLKSSKYEHDLVVEGDLVVKGNLKVDGEITCFKLKEE